MHSTRTRHMLLRESLRFIASYEGVDPDWKRGLLVDVNENILREIGESGLDTHWLGNLVNFLTQSEMIPTRKDRRNYFLAWTKIIFELRQRNILGADDAKKGLEPSIILLDLVPEGAFKEIRSACVSFLFDLRRDLSSDQARRAASEFLALKGLDSKSFSSVLEASDIELFNILEFKGDERVEGGAQIGNFTLEFDQDFPSSSSSWIVIKRDSLSSHTNYLLYKIEDEKDESEEDLVEAIQELKEWTIEMISEGYEAKRDRGDYTWISQLGSSWMKREGGVCYIPAKTIVKSNGWKRYQDFVRETLEEKFPDMVNWISFGNNDARVKIIEISEKSTLQVDIGKISRRTCKQIGIDYSEGWIERGCSVFLTYWKEGNFAFRRSQGSLRINEVQKIRLLVLEGLGYEMKHTKQTSFGKMLSEIEEVISKSSAKRATLLSSLGSRGYEIATPSDPNVLFSRPEQILSLVARVMLYKAMKHLRNNPSVPSYHYSSIRYETEREISDWEKAISAEILEKMPVHRRSTKRGKGRAKLGTSRGGRK